jgi:hypothetical protein
MPLLHIAARAPTGQYFSVGFYLMSREKTDDIYWALQAFNRVCRYDNLKDPNVILTNDAKALYKATGKPGIWIGQPPRLLYLFHVNKAVEARVNTNFKGGAGDHRD